MLAKAGMHDRLDAWRVLDLCQLRRDIGVARPVGLVGDELDAAFLGDLETLFAHRFAEPVRRRHDADFDDVAGPHVLEDLLARHSVRVGRLVDELAYGFDDLDCSRERDEGDLRLLEHGMTASETPVIEPPTTAITLSSSTRRVAKVRALLASPLGR